MTETISARWVSDICRMENGFTVAVYRCVEGKTSNSFRARGQELPDTQRTVNLTGEFQDTKYGRTFVVSAFELKPPDTKKEFIKYASSLGIGLGKVKAKRLFELCGPKVWQMIEDDNLPAEAFRIAWKDVYEKLATKMSEQNTERAIMKLLDGMVNVDLGDLRKANITSDILRLNPYTLCVFGARFAAVDAWAQAKGLVGSLDDKNRIEAALHEALKNAAANGSCCLTGEIMLNGDRKRGIEGALSMLNAKTYAVSQELAHQTLLDICSAGRIVLNSGHYYAKDAYLEEVFVAKKVVEMARTKADGRPPLKKYTDALYEYQKAEGICLSDEQEAAVLALAQYNLMIVTGYPGAGKTTTIKAMLHVVSKVEKLERENMLLLSPTGKAARRMEEATGYPASTVLSALNFNGVNTEDILRSEDPLDADIIIVDETSMMDLQQMAMLLRHVSSNSRLVLIGDPDQLPSVGAGNVLLDLIRSREVPVFLLSKIYRQKSAQYVNPIPGNAALIREGNINLVWEKNKESAFMLAPRYEDEKIFSSAISLYTSIVQKSDLTVDDVCMLVPYRKKNRVTKLTSTEFNLALQQKINPVRATDSIFVSHGISFHKGDKVMQLKNTEGPKNGDVGYVESITYSSAGDDGTPEKVVRINFNGTLVEYGAKDMQFVDLAYASSVHKMQGSQADTVILVVSSAHGALLARALVYTAITRAIKHVIVVGELEAFNRAIMRDNTADPERSRITLLASRIHHEAQKTSKKEAPPLEGTNKSKTKE